MDQVTKKKETSKNILLSLLCGVSVAITLILRPIISFYLSNEGEFWFSLGSVIGNVLLVFFGVAIVVGAVHFILPHQKEKSLQLIYAALAAAFTLGIYIQSNFMASYLPVLTGETIDWSQYGSWNIGSILLWGFLFVLAIVGFVLKPGWTKKAAYGILTVLLCMSAITGGIEMITAKHENKKAETYCSGQGLYETSQGGNIVVLVSDTFEGTFMNEILEQYPEYREILSDITYYDNTTGVANMTYFSYAKFLTGIDFPMGLESEQGTRYCFDHETTLSKVNQNGWDIAYYTEFSPPESVEKKIINFGSDALTPDGETAWKLTGLLVRSTLFQSMPHPIKKSFIVYTQDYSELMEQVKSSTEKAKPYVIDDVNFYNTIATKGLETSNAKPRYSVYELWGVHGPAKWDTDFNYVKYDDSVPVSERRSEVCRASLKMLRAYLDSLKAAGTYDDTTVILMADHGFNLRYYPVFLVKEAHREKTGFVTDSTPISLDEDYEDLIVGMTQGKTLSQIVSEMQLADNRIRHAKNYRGDDDYGTKTIFCYEIAIDGNAKDKESYKVEKDTFYIEENTTEYKLGEPIIQNSEKKGNATIYGLNNRSCTYGHTILFDINFDQEVKNDIKLKMTAYNTAGTDQNLIFKTGDKLLGEKIIKVNETIDIEIPIPAPGTNKIQLEINLPEAVLNQNDGETLGWNTFSAIGVTDVSVQ